ncbi:MAG TPA: peptidoglycan DD-metalloendopeptidase family protein [Anaerolineales bacterium]|nr:peptidoglycan DD-metalloendopeptidase family protein [Anaerolineales bacterium]
MPSDFPEPDPEADPNAAPEPTPRRPRRASLDLARYGLREPLLRLGGHLAVLAIVALGVWAARLGLDRLPEDGGPSSPAAGAAAGATPGAQAAASISDLPPYSGGPLLEAGISRQAMAHTVFPTRPRLEVIRYVVQSGDTVFGIAENFNLNPQSILWGNYDVLTDDPHNLQPGQELNVPPVDGTLYTWHQGDTLAGVAGFFGVEPQDIADWPGNDIPPGSDLSNPPIEAGSLVMVPGGHREFTNWSAPRISRTDPAVARLLGPGACAAAYDGPIGDGVFGWPTNLHYLTGYDYSPAANHPAIDIAGDEGHAIYASDDGVIVYSGWHNGGYGLVIVIDHGNGWQTLYAHLSQINFVCGQAVYQGNVIGLMGSTGNSSGAHLHFEIMHETYGKVNPWDFLP